MSIRFGCPHCDSVAHVADEFAGRVASCARCGNLMTVPGTSVPTAHDDQIVYINDRDKTSWGSKLGIVLGICVCLIIPIALFLPVPGRISERAHRVTCMNNLKQIALALHNYHDAYGSFPPAYTTDENGRPMHSWRVFLPPFMESSNFYEQYNFHEPWDSPNNLKMIEMMPAGFQCPSANAEQGFTHYVVVIGDPYRFPQTMFSPDRAISLSEVLDGASQTILVAEVQRAVPWTMPGADLVFNNMTMHVNGSPASISSLHPHGARVAMADGSVHRLDDNLDSQTLRNLLQPADGNPVEDF